MTYEQAEMIVTLGYVPETTILSQIQELTMLAEMKAQCNRGRNTPHEDFVYYSGLIEGLKRAGFKTLLQEAKLVIREAKQKEKSTGFHEG